MLCIDQIMMNNWNLSQFYFQGRISGFGQLNLLNMTKLQEKTWSIGIVMIILDSYDSKYMM